MKKSIIKALKTLFAGAALLSLASCSGLFSDVNAPKSSQSDADNITVTFETSTLSRTALPEVNLSAFKYKVLYNLTSASDYTTSSAFSGPSAISLSLKTGTYDFIVNAYTSSDTSYTTPVLTGTVTGKAISTTSSSVSVTLAAATGGTGSVSITLNIAQKLGVSTVSTILTNSITSSDTGTKTAVTSGTSYDTFTYSNDSVASGVSQYVIFFLYDSQNNLVTSYVDAVYVVAGLSSEDSHTIDGSTFTAQVTIQKNGSVWTDSPLTVTLVNTTDSSVTATTASTGTAVSIANVSQDATFAVYVNGSDTGKTVSSSSTSETLNYLVPTLYPSQGATDAFADTQLIMTFASEPTLVANSTVSITSGSSTVDTITVNSTSQDESQSAQSGYTINVGNQQLVRTDGNSVYIQPHYNGTSSATVLQASTSYTVDVSGIVDSSAYDGMLFEDGTDTWSFTTKSVPSASSTMTVSNATTSNTADFFSVYGALWAASVNGSAATQYQLDIADGTYYELVSVKPKSGQTIILHGTSESSKGSGVSIEYVNNQYLSALLTTSSAYSSQAQRASFYVANGNLILENVTLENLTQRTTSYSYTGKYYDADITYNGSQIAKSGAYQAEALNFASGAGSTLTAYNSSFVSLQDTILTSGKVWFYGCYIAGDVDFIWGTSDVALFENCDIECLNTSATTAYIFESRVGSTSGTSVGKGYVLLNSTVTVDSGVTAYYARRASGKSSTSYYDQVALVNVDFSSTPAAAHWYVGNEPESITDSTVYKYGAYSDVGWKEYGVTVNGSAVSTSSRYANSGDITATEYENEYSGRRGILNRFFTKGDGSTENSGSYAKDTTTYWAIDDLISERSYSVTTDSSKETLDGEAVVTSVVYDFTAASSLNLSATSYTTASAPADLTNSGFSYHGTTYGIVGGSGAAITVPVEGTCTITLYNSYQTSVSDGISISVTAGDSGDSITPTSLTAGYGDWKSTPEELTVSYTDDGDSSGSATFTLGGNYVYLAKIVVTYTSGGESSSESGETSEETEVTITYFPSSASSFTAAGTSSDTGIVTAANASATTGTTGTLSTAFGTVNTTTGHYYTTGSIAGSSDDTILTLTLTLTAVEDFTISSVTGSVDESASGNISRTLKIGTNDAVSLGTGKNLAISKTGINYAVSSGNTVDLVFTTTATSSYSGKTFKQLFNDIVITVTTTAEGSGTSGAGESSEGETASASDVIIDNGSVISDSDTSSRTSSLTISASDVPTGYAGVGYSDTYGTLEWTTQTVSTRSALVSAAKHSSGNYFIIVDGMIDMTDGMLPSIGGGTTDELDAFVNTNSSGEYTTYAEWVAAYATACSTTSDDEESGSGNTDLYSMLWTLSNAYKSQIQLVVASNTIIVGNDASSGIKGANISISGGSNIQLRNLTIQDAYDPFPHHEVSSSGTSDGYNAQWDGITIQGDCSYIWIDHCTIQDTMKVGHVYTGGTGGTSEKWQTYDGLLDIKGGGQYITVSYCKFKNHDKTSLIGNTDSTETYTKTGESSKTTLTEGYRKITYHHNYFYNCGQRLPMVRYTTMHLYNNLYAAETTPPYDQQYAVGVRTGSIIYSENNYFDSGILYAFSGDSSSSKVGTFYSNGDEADTSVTLYNSSKGISASNGDTLFSAGPAAYTYTADSISTVQTNLPSEVGPGTVTIN